MRGRDAGFQSYNQYRKICGMKEAKEWEDFHDTIDKDVSFILILYQNWKSHAILFIWCEPYRYTYALKAKMWIVINIFY